LAELRSVGDCVAGEKLAAVGRKVGRVFVIAGTGAQRVYIRGDPAAVTWTSPSAAHEARAHSRPLANRDIVMFHQQGLQGPPRKDGTGLPAPEPFPWERGQSG